MKNILEIDSVQLSYDNRKILQSVYLKIGNGEVVGLLGRNGCGKTSLLKMIYGELAIGEKSVRVNKQALLTGRRDPAVMRMCPHRNFIPSSFTVEEVLNDFGLDYSALCDRFPEFDKVYKQRAGNLSGGNQRVLEVYVILMSNTQFVFLDEPFSYLSPRNVAVLCELISEEKKSKGILVTDHAYRTVLELSDRLYLLRDGIVSLVSGEEELVQKGYLPVRN